MASAVEIEEAAEDCFTRSSSGHWSRRSLLAWFAMGRAFSRHLNTLSHWLGQPSGSETHQFVVAYPSACLLVCLSLSLFCNLNFSQFNLWINMMPLVLWILRAMVSVLKMVHAKPCTTVDQWDCSTVVTSIRWIRSKSSWKKCIFKCKGRSEQTIFNYLWCFSKFSLKLQLVIK